jgi:hypothetical protein
MKKFQSPSSGQRRESFTRKCASVIRKRPSPEVTRFTGHLCPGLAGAEALCDGDDFCESVGESVEGREVGPFGRERRNISSTWWAPDSTLVTPARPTRKGATEGLARASDVAALSAPVGIPV